MRRADIRIGQEYAVRVNPEQVVITWPVDPDDDLWGPNHYARRLLSHVHDRAPGFRAEVVAIERTDGAKRARSVVRVELTASIPRVHFSREDHLDGTYTDWKGITCDEDGDVILDDRRFEAVIELSQVETPWAQARAEWLARGDERARLRLAAQLERPDIIERWLTDDEPDV